MKNILITGGHSGMGLELTKMLLAEGHHIGIVVRSEKRRKDAIELLGTQDRLEMFIADLSKRDQIERVTKEIIQQWDKIDGIFNNAGVLLDKLYFSDYGNELHLEINALSPYLMTQSLKSLLDKSDAPFVVNTATGGLETKKSIDIKALKRPTSFSKLTGSYMDSKLALALLMNHLGKEWGNVRMVHVNPGAIKTKMTKGSGMPGWLMPIRNLFFMSPQRGAQSLYNAAFSKKYKGSNIFINAGKVLSLKIELTDKEVAAFF